MGMVVEASDVYHVRKSGKGGKEGSFVTMKCSGCMRRGR